MPAFADLTIDLFIPGDTGASTSPLTTHAGALQTNYISTDGQSRRRGGLPGRRPRRSRGSSSRASRWPRPTQVGAVVAFGDSITDGTRSTPNTNNRWPDYLAKRLAASNVKMGVLNEGIAGNRVLCDGAGVSALARFDRDVLVQPGVDARRRAREHQRHRHRAEQPVADAPPISSRRISSSSTRAHAHGLKIYGATLTPFEGAAYATPEGEAKRQALNDWIRTSKAYDGVIDFDAAVRDPGGADEDSAAVQPRRQPAHERRRVQAMADAIDLGLFTHK